MPKAKPYSGPVEESVARQLLNSTGHAVDINGESLLLGDALLAAAKQLAELVSEANTQLDNNDFAKIVADHLAADLNRRGKAEIAVHDNGSVQLHINYQGNPRNQKQKQKRKRNIPLMEELKARAEKLGVEIPEEFGIKRSKIFAWLNEYEAGGVPKEAASKPKKAARKRLEVAEDPPETDLGPMSAGPDETKVSAPLDEAKLPKKRGFVKTSEALSGPVFVGADAVGEPKPAPEAESNRAKKPAEDAPKAKGRSMRQLVEESKEVDISNLLASEPPK